MKEFRHRSKLILISLVFSLAFLGCAEGRGSGVSALRAGVKHIKSEEAQAGVTQAILAFEKAESLEPFFEKSYGCAIFPTIGKGGIGIGGAYGKGYVFRQGDFAGSSSMTQLTVGFQWGGQAYSQIVFFKDEEACDDFTSGNFEFGAQASAVAITAGASAQASTGGGSSASAGRSQSDSFYIDGMAIFTRAKGGLMYEATIGGQKFNFKPLKK